MNTTMQVFKGWRTKKAVISFFSTALALFVLSSCAKNTGFQVNSGEFSIPSQNEANLEQGGDEPEYKAEPLAWESATKPERLVWSAATMEMVSDLFDSLNKAQDINVFCPKYASLTKNQKINVWADLFAALAYYESSWNPASNSVDVGTGDNKDTWSVGLLQMSVVDQANYGYNFGYSFTDLQQAIPNLHLGITIMARQIVKKGIILIPTGGTGLYWATLHPGGNYDQTAAIAKMTKKLSFCQ